jgi:hypothetical protein
MHHSICSFSRGWFPIGLFVFHGDEWTRPIGVQSLRCHPIVLKRQAILLHMASKGLQLIPPRATHS